MNISAFKCALLLGPSTAFSRTSLKVCCWFWSLSPRICHFFVIYPLNAQVCSKRKNEAVVAACIILNSLLVRLLSWEQLTIEL